MRRHLYGSAEASPWILRSTPTVCQKCSLILQREKECLGQSSLHGTSSSIASTLRKTDRCRSRCSSPNSIWCWAFTLVGTTRITRKHSLASFGSEVQLKKLLLEAQWPSSSSA